MSRWGGERCVWREAYQQNEIKIHNKSIEKNNNMHYNFNTKKQISKTGKTGKTDKTKEIKRNENINN